MTVIIAVENGTTSSFVNTLIKEIESETRIFQKRNDRIVMDCIFSILCFVLMIMQRVVFEKQEGGIKCIESKNYQNGSPDF